MIDENGTEISSGAAAPTEPCKVNREKWKEPEKVIVK